MDSLRNLLLLGLAGAAIWGLMTFIERNPGAKVQGISHRQTLEKIYDIGKP